MNINVHKFLEATGKFQGLDERGDEIWAHCPFAEKTHKDGVDEHPSWSINRTTGYWHCFACDEGGSLPDLFERLDLPRVEGLDATPTDHRTWEQSFHIHMQSYAGEQDNWEKTNEVWSLPENFRTFREGDQHLAAHYVFSVMGFTIETVRRFGIGYCESTDYYGSGPTVVFPIADGDGRQVSWIQRRLGTLTDNRPRYLFPKGFKKGHYLYNIHSFKRHQHAVLVEGAKAVVHLDQLGIQAIASFGAALSEQQVALLSKLGGITLLYDADRAGDLATLKAISLLDQHYAGEIYIAYLPMTPTRQQEKLTGPDDYPIEIVQRALQNRLPIIHTKSPTIAEIRKKLDSLGNVVIF